MNKFDLYDLYAYAQVMSEPLLGHHDMNYMTEYNSNYKTLDFSIMHDYGSFSVISNADSIDSAYAEFSRIIDSILIIKNSKYKKLYDSLFFEYNPIENYSMTESGNDVRTPQLQTDITSVYGADTTTETSTDSTMPYDSTEYVERNKNINEFTRHPRNDTTATVNSGNETTTHKFTRKGNIGTLTTQSMIESERRIAYFSFFKVLIRDIIAETCIIQDYVSWGCDE